MSVNFEGIGKEAIVEYFKVLSRNLSEVSQENHENPPPLPLKKETKMKICRHWKFSVLRIQILKPFSVSSMEIAKRMLINYPAHNFGLLTVNTSSEAWVGLWQHETVVCADGVR